jgi:Tfp pilus assembly protein PilF
VKIDAFQKTFTEGVAAARANKPDEAIDKFTRALELNPNCAECNRDLAQIHYGQGISLWDAGKITDAKKHFEAALKADPNQAESHYQLGLVLVNEGKLAAAADEFDRYLTLAPKGPNAELARSLLTQLRTK